MELGLPLSSELLILELRTLQNIAKGWEDRFKQGIPTEESDYVDFCRKFTGEMFYLSDKAGSLALRADGLESASEE